MNRLVNGLVAMSSLRDRAALDNAVVQLAADCCGDGVESVTLVRIVGESGDQRCLTLADWSRLAVSGQSDAAWGDWTSLPRLSDFADRKAACDTQKVVLGSGDAPGVVLPIAQPLGEGVSTLEVRCSNTPEGAALHALESIAAQYKNLMGLLDYGEKDALTELLNRKSFDGSFFKATEVQFSQSDVLADERRTQANGASYWLAMLDIDHFKRVNDNFGHLIGDEVLLLLARLMRANFRLHDKLYRFGGEEFVILMRCPDAHDAHAALERLRVRVEAHVFPQVGCITVSIGFCALLQRDTPGSAFGRADKAVYYAKGHGRNQVCHYEHLVACGELEQPVSEDMDVDLF